VNDYVEYDASIIQEFALQLYRRAKSIVITSTALGAIVGAVGGAFLGNGALSNVNADPMVNIAVGAIFGALIVGAMGLSAGRARAFALKLQAQVALCQTQIERNTRPTKTHPANDQQELLYGRR
jgi:hypothetical protein